MATITSAGVLTGVSSGTSVITYTDNNGCTVTETVTVNALPTVSVSPTSATIISGNSQSLTASGATSYSWSPSTGLSATTGGTVTASPTTTTTYTVTGTDGNGCENLANTVITVSSSLSGGVIGSNQSICSGGDPVAFTSTSAASGGTGNYTYEWEYSTNSGSSWTSISSSNKVIYDAPNGITVTTLYRRKVADGSNTEYSNTITVTVNAKPTITTSNITHVSCKWYSDGSIDVSVNGGTSPYTYSWTGPLGYSSSVEDPTFLLSGSYSLNVSDSNGCSVSSSSMLVDEPNAISVSAISSTNITCNGSTDGIITITATGGGTLKYSIDNGSTYQTSNSFIGLSASIYTVDVSDNNSCTATYTPNKVVTITEPTALTVSNSSQTNVDCNGNSTGSVTVSAAGGTSPYEYKIGTGSYGTSAAFSSLSAGSYTVTAKDANGCTQTLS